MIANDVFFLDSRGEGGGGGRSRRRPGQPAGREAPAGAAGGDLPVDRSDMQPATAADDDIPF